ncbi:MAG: glycoside hydrolase family 43 protein [Lachnospiraceae bacterium]|nr:glycoside hydrolase family 43 protein [Lachnospiraceae bacterium]
MTVIAKNPILSGFYPDPSICAVGEDYYLINSTFAYFPGLPIMHSKDLVHWEQIGNAMDRNSQLPLSGCGHSQGLFAPTIRYHEGTYYVICTNVSHGGNYIVTAASPEGPWSEPYYLEGAQGIDPSLFFDEDGTCYYIGTRPNQEGCKYGGDWYIWIQELDLKEMKLIGEPKDVWNGAMKNVIWPEGPHLYKKNGYYYIMNAEGGTGPDHAVTVCRSRNIWGPYENNNCNPILTHRHLGWAYPIKYVGHADMIETPKGDWYMVMLAVRPLEGYTTMGRETFLAKVTWENDWPVVNPGVGMLTDTVEVNLEPWDPVKDRKSYTNQTGKKTAVPGSNRQYDFSKMKQLGDEFLMLRNPGENMYELKPKEGLKLSFGKWALREEASPSYIGIRQQHHQFMVSSWLSMEGIKGDKKAGITLLQSNEYHLRLEVSENKVEAILCQKGQDNILGMAKYDDADAVLFMAVDGLKATVGVDKGEEEIFIAKDIDIRCLSTEVAGGFVGCTVGMYAVNESPDHADDEAAACFRGFTYESI